MRNTAVITISVILGLTIWFNTALAFDIEDEKLFEAKGSARTVSIISTTDLIYFAPLIDAFQEATPNISVQYTVASSKELFKAIYDEQADYDLVISSAMDLQVKLVNDGLTQAYTSSETASMPDWAHWRNHLFAFTQEPAVLLGSKKMFAELNLPENRQDIITLLRENPDKFKGKIGTYDIRDSGAGYLFATQDARQSDVYWRLAEVIGSLNPTLYCCSSKMLAALESGDIALAYNVMGSYASAVLKDDSNGFIIPLSDYTHFMLRTALIPKQADSADLAGRFIDFLIGATGRELVQEVAGLPPIDGEALATQLHFRPINLGPELLVYLDKIKRRRFLKDWSDAMIRQ